MHGEQGILVACCDDSQVMRVLITALVEEAEGLGPAGEATNGREAVELVEARPAARSRS